MLKLVSPVLFACAISSAAVAQHPGRHQDFHPSMSPDGGQVVFYSYRQPNFPDLFLVDRETLEETQLTDTPALWEIEPDWSPTRNLVAYSRGPSMRELAMVIRNMDTGQERVVGQGVNAAWSRDGEQLAWMQDRTIWIANAEGEHAHPLELGAVGEGTKSEPSWSYDGTALLFLYENPDDSTASRFEVYAYFLADGAIARMTANGFQETHAILHPNGEEMIFASSLISPNPRIYRVNADRTGHIRQISPDMGNLMHYFPSIGSDRETLLFEAGRWAEQTFYIYEQPLDGEGQTRRLTGPVAD